MPHSAMSTCRFCRFTKTAGISPIDTPWLSDGDYFAVASVGALIEGWSLVCTRNHLLSLRGEYAAEKFWAFAGRAIDTVKSVYGPVVLFEHGSSSEDSSTSCGTAHAHLHIVPFGADLKQIAESFDSTLAWQTCDVGELNSLVAGEEYLAIIEGNSTSMEAKVAVLRSGRSQFFRRVIASHIGRAPEFNYREHPQPQVSLATALSLRQAVSEAESQFENAA